MKKIFSIIFLLSAFTIACKNNSDTPTPQGATCDFNSLTQRAGESYDFNSDFSAHFSQSTRWESHSANITLVNGKGRLTANSGNVSQALEAWKLYKVQMPYNKSWEISVEVTIPTYWNSNGGNNAQVGAGIFVGKPVPSGQSSKVYECNMAVINRGERFVQAQLVANRLGDDPIDVQHTVLSQSKEMSSLKIQFCASNKTLSLFVDNVIVGSGKSIDSSGLDNWGLSGNDLMDVGVMGFAENTVITSNQPVIDNFRYTIY